MTKRLISFFLALILFIAIPLSARYKYNPYTRKLDYYEPAGDAELGDLGDVTLTGLATGNILYYSGTAWVNLATGANTQFLTLAAGIPAWAAIPAGVTTFLGLTDTPAAYAGKAGQLVRVNAGANALEFFAGSPLGTVIIADGAGGWTKTENYRVSAAGAVTLGSWTGTAVANAYVAGINQNLLTTSTPTFDDLTISTPVNIYGLSHNSFADYAANRHVALPTTIAAVLTDHNAAAHTALGFRTLPDTIADVLTDHALAAHTAAIGGTGQNSSAWTDYVYVNAGAWGQDTTLGRVANGLQITGAGGSTVTITNDATDAKIVSSTANMIIESTGGGATIEITGDLVPAADASYDMGNNTLAWQDIVQTSTGAHYFGDTNVNGSWQIVRSGASLSFQRRDAGAFVEQVYVGSGFGVPMTANADKIIISQSAAGTENEPLIFIEDDRTTNNTAAEASVVIDNTTGFGWALNVHDGYSNFDDRVYMNSRVYPSSIYFDDDALFRWGTGNGEVLMSWDSNGTGDQLFLFDTALAQGAGEATAFFFSNLNPNNMTDHNGYLTPTLILANDEGADANDYAGVVIGERAQADVKVAHYFDFFAMTGAADGSVDPANAEIGATFRFGDTGTTVPTYATGPGDVIFEDDIEVIGTSHKLGDTTSYEDVFWTWADAADHAVIAQSAVAGTAGQALIYVDDDRTGDTANSKQEAALVLDAAGWYSLWCTSGAQFDDQVNFTDKAVHDGHIVVNDARSIQYGTSTDFWTTWDTNGAGDDLLVNLTGFMQVAGNTAVIWYGYMNPNGMTTHDNYLSPTFIITNSEGADANDYAGVVIGERAQANVAVAHYFDFYAMTGAVDAAVDPTTTEIAATFRFGDSGSAVPNHATGPGDVLFEDDVEVDGNTYFGDASNYAHHATDGGLTLYGTARVIKCKQIGNAHLGSGGTKPDEINVGNYWGWSYDINDDSIFTVRLPMDWCAGTDVLIYIRWAINEAYITNSGEVRWQATWSAHPADASEAIDDAGTTDDSGDINIPATAYFLTETLVETIPAANLSAGDEIGINIERIGLTGGSNPTADPVITCVGIVYTSDKLGTDT